MACYVDDAFIYARVGKISTRWCHLMADDRAELVAFARQLGLNPTWIQDKPSGVHFDVTGRKRLLAVQLGAVEIHTRSDRWREVVAAARRQHTPAVPA